MLLLLVYHDMMNERCTLGMLDCDVEVNPAQTSDLWRPQAPLSLLTPFLLCCVVLAGDSPPGLLCDGEQRLRLPKHSRERPPWQET